MLAERGLHPAEIGVVVGAGLAGGAAGTALVAAVGDRSHRARALRLWALLGAFGLAGVAWTSELALLLPIVAIGMVNGMGRDRGPAQTLEQAALADLEGPATRTAVLGRYALIQDLGGAAGALLAGFPVWLQAAGVSSLSGYRLAFGVLAIAVLASALCYRKLPDRVPAQRAGGSRPTLAPTTRRRVSHFAGLTLLDSLGGGMLAGSILAYWFFQRFGLRADQLGALFFVARGLNGASYLLAPVLARRIGLLRTMVFTHVPSSVVLLLLPVTGTAIQAGVLFLLREAMVQMDVPTRQAYLAAITSPGERAFAMGTAGVSRSIGWSVGAPLAGAGIAALGLAAPLFGGAVLKIAYDLALFFAFRRVETGELAAEG
jgi:predicted MFS family arabinose efflux permease